MSQGGHVVEVLGLEVVPLPAAGAAGSRPARSRPAARRRAPPAPRSSISRPGTAASTSTLSSTARAVAIAAGSSAQSSTRLIPIDEPPRAGLTNTGSPSRSRSAARRASPPARTTAYGPTGSPSAASSFLVNSLSIADGAAEHAGAHVRHAGHLQQPLDRPVLAERPVQHREDDVHPVQHPGALAGLDHDEPAGGRVAGQHHRRAVLRPWAARARRSRSVSGSPEVITQAPLGVIPTGTTSYRAGSSAARTLPADTQEIACSVLRPPKTTATRTLRPGWDMRGTLPGDGYPVGHARSVVSGTAG